MFRPFITALTARIDARRSTAFLLSRLDDHLLDDIGVTRAELEAHHLSRAPSTPLPRMIPVFPLRLSLPERC